MLLMAPCKVAWKSAVFPEESLASTAAARARRSSTIPVLAGKMTTSPKVVRL